MKREILFRGKRVEIGQFATESVCEWAYGGYAADSSGTYIYDFMRPKRMVKVDPATVGQYTGLEDKNGVKIFEGDIVDLFGLMGEVVQGCGAFGIRFSRTIDYALLESKIPYNNTPFFAYNDNFISLWEIFWNYEQDDNHLYEVEVIGKIHDNPELLEANGHE